MDKVDARKLTAEGRKLLRQMVIRLRKQSGICLLYTSDAADE